MISFGRIVRGCITEFGRGGACVPARVALQGRIRRSSPAHNACIFGMETPLRERSGGHAGTAPTASFGWIVRKRLMSLGWIARKWLFCLYGIAWKNMVEVGRGGAYVPARVALQGRIRRSSLAHNACIFGMETPLRERSGGHAGTAPTVSFGWIACKWLFCLCGIAWKNITERGRGGVCVPARAALQGCICCSSGAGMALSFDVEKVVFIFICIFASNKNVNQEQSWNV